MYVRGAQEGLNVHDLTFDLVIPEKSKVHTHSQVVSNPDPSLFRSAGCIASPARESRPLPFPQRWMYCITGSGFETNSQVEKNNYRIAGKFRWC